MWLFCSFRVTGMNLCEILRLDSVFEITFLFSIVLPDSCTYHNNICITSLTPTCPLFPGLKDVLSVVSQKGESQNGGNKKTKHAKFSEKRLLLAP